jgi:hypothetical protein
MEDRLLRIKQKLTDAKVLNQTLSERQVAAFEKRHHITLPEGYRRFLIKIGNGGDGPPHYRLVTLGKGPNSANQDEVRYWEQLPHVHLAFPFTEPWVWEGGDVSEEGTEEQVRHGSIFLGEDGCGMDWHLIVTGAERGNVWMICGEGVVPTLPKRDFLTWYEDWLDGVKNWFVAP